MSNYIVEDEVKDYGYYKMTPKDNNKSMFIIGVAVLIVFIIIIIAFPKKKDAYLTIEEKMVETASEYVYENNIPSDNEIYLDVSKLNFDLPDSCSSLSGVIYNEEEFTPYLLCRNYESKILDNDDSLYQLKGHEIVFLLKGMSYIELGYTGNEMIVSSNIKEDEGVYNVYYISQDSHVLMRKVIVLDNPNLYDYYPKMEMTSDNPIVIEKGASLPLPTVIDNIDGDINNNIVYYSDIDLSTSGEYKVIYNVRNSMGYETSLAKNIVVTDDLNSYNNFQITVTLSTENMTNQNVYAHISIAGDGYDYIVLPNGEKLDLSNFVYVINENGEYEFVAMSKMGVMNKKKVTINNIDRTPPVGTCSATIYSNKTTVSVNVTSFNYIIGYNYHFNGKESGYSKNSNYTINETTNSVSVEIMDYIGNTAIIDCSTKKGDPTVNNPNIKYYVYNNTEYVIPNTRNDLTVFENRVCNKLAQNSDVGNCGSACLSFALYYAAYLQRGDLSKMNLYNACHYNYGGVAGFTTLSNKTKRDALNYIYDEINRGKVMSLQVTGTLARSSRHFVTVVGYKRSVYKREYLQEEDLLVIDSWNGCFKTLSYADTTKRTMYDNKDGKGYRLDVIKN